MIKIIYAMMNERKSEGFEDNLRFPPGEYEIMIFQTPVYIEVDGVMNPYPTHTCILYKPGQLIHYRAQSGELLYDWIRFDCDEALYTEGFLPFGIPVFCTNYTGFITYWRAIANENFWQNDSHEFVNEQLMHIIFHLLHDYANMKDTHENRADFMHLRNQIYQHPEKPWTLENMASYVHLSVRSLQKLYKSFFHTTCNNELINSRITQSKFLLVHTSNSIEKVAERCGYNNTEHFCRQFKQKEGISPSQYRKLSEKEE